MINPPRTREEAKKVRYSGYPYMVEWCAYKRTRFGIDVQCFNDPGHGPGKLYCKQHAKMVEDD